MHHTGYTLTVEKVHGAVTTVKTSAGATRDFSTAMLMSFPKIESTNPQPSRK